MEPIPIRVQCYAGHKADELPQRFLCQSCDVEIGGILDRWQGAEKDSKEPKADYFKVAGKDGHDYLLKHDLNSDQWFLENRW